jgi:hypothetical protein
MTLTPIRFSKLVLDLNRLVEQNSEGSALRGLTVLGHAFAALLDAYAAPNDGNPEGMCDDWFKFRNHFAEIMLAAPRATQAKAVKKATAKKGAR